MSAQVAIAAKVEGDMFELISIFGVQMVLSFVLGYGAQAADAEEPQEGTSGSAGNEDGAVATFTDAGDHVVSDDHSDDVASYLLGLVGDGILTQSEADARLDDIEFISGEMAVDVGAGDDTLIGSDADDRFLAGEGNDIVQAGDGDDRVSLESGDDTYGVDDRVRPSSPNDHVSFPTLDALVSDDPAMEAGDDTIWGGSGDDMIADGFGNNLIYGSTGHDFIVTVDQDVDDEGVSADTVSGAWGRDEIIVDEGDNVTTGEGGDWIAVDIWNMVESGYDPVSILDFNPEEDQLVLMGEYASFFSSTLADPDEEPELLVSVENASDGEAAIVFVSGIPVVIVTGGQGMSTSDIELRPY